MEEVRKVAFFPSGEVVGVKQEEKSTLYRELQGKMNLGESIFH